MSCVLAALVLPKVRLCEMAGGLNGGGEGSVRTSELLLLLPLD